MALSDSERVEVFKWRDPDWTLSEAGDAPLGAGTEAATLWARGAKESTWDRLDATPSNGTQEVLVPDTETILQGSVGPISLRLQRIPR